MSPPLSPVRKMSHAHPIRTLSTDPDSIRKRVCKACDRCRLKKSKCDGSTPCSRCKADNAICVFGERKKSQDKVYPKGYVEMLEQQQQQLVAGLQEMYKRSRAGREWAGPILSEANGHPLTHDILAALHLLEKNASGDLEEFEEDTLRLQSRLLAEGAGYMAHPSHRRGSSSSDSEHSAAEHLDSDRAVHSRSTSAVSAVPSTIHASHQPDMFRDNFSFTSSQSSVSSPLSPVPRSVISYPPQQHQQHLHHHHQQYQHQQQPSSSSSSSSPVPFPQQSQQARQQFPQQPARILSHGDPQFFQAEWAIPDMSTPQMMQEQKQRYSEVLQGGLNAPELYDGTNASNFDLSGLFETGVSNGYYSMSNTAYQANPYFSADMPAVLDLDPMELELNRFSQAAA